MKRLLVVIALAGLVTFAYASMTYAAPPVQEPVDAYRFGDGNTTCEESLQTPNAGGQLTGGWSEGYCSDHLYHKISGENACEEKYFHAQPSVDQGWAFGPAPEDCGEEPPCEVDCEEECTEGCEQECEVDCEEECTVDCEEECTEDCDPVCTENCEEEPEEPVLGWNRACVAVEVDWEWAKNTARLLYKGSCSAVHGTQTHPNDAGGLFDTDLLHGNWGDWFLTYVRDGVRIGYFSLPDGDDDDVWVFSLLGPNGSDTIGVYKP